ncbi:phage tail protein [Neptunomonas marina]|uniref:Phage tail protein n=1 Tax=Neptunomonas marina TaxID=1815562 RepID=A0A437QAT1_9GAMM|nr:tail fiber protein [Neptunomonas marina]RVU31640.1 phage tail protein [Neptunomonas marina]
MSEPYVGEIRMFAGNFAPRGWAFCDGQLLAVSQNDALFSLLGTIYGGDGRTTFGLPDLRGRAPIHAGQGSGLTNRTLGGSGGRENVYITANQLPPHSHSLLVSSSQGNQSDPTGHYFSDTSVAGRDLDGYSSTDNSGISVLSSSLQGGSRSHTNMQPSLAVHYIIALVGIYPSRS